MNRDGGVSTSERTSAAAKNKDSRCRQGRISPQPAEVTLQAPSLVFSLDDDVKAR